MTAKLPTILDNRGDNTVLAALQKLLPLSEKVDIATGTFELGSLLALEPLWKALKKIRIIMGDETTRRTKKEILSALTAVTDYSIESEKERDDSLTGLAAVRQAITDKQISTRVYTKAKFHAKCYLLDAKDESHDDLAFVGSSNFTRPGLIQNLELNLASSDRVINETLRSWYNEIWKEGEDVSAELLKVIEPHLREYDPFTVYAKALYEYFAGREKLQDDWELNESVIYPKLSQYQRDGYHRALQIADEWDGALICDGVGLGKTYIGLMILERCIHDGKRVLMIVPKSAEESVWKSNMRRLLEPKYPRQIRELIREKGDLRRYTDFGREGGISEVDYQYYKDFVDVIIIDEAHHFRNHLANRSEVLMDLTDGKKLHMLTATPINNHLDDLYHLINYFAQNRQDHFARIGINHFRKHFLDHERRVKEIAPEQDVVEITEKEDLLRQDSLLKNVLIQRSRKYVKDSEFQENGAPLFPERQPPRVIYYSLKTVYETLYGEIKEAFDKDDPFLSLAIYNTSAYHKEPEKQTKEYQRLVVGLIRTLLLKRLESSFKAFEASVEDLLAKMAQFLRRYRPEAYEAWETTNRRWWSIVQQHIRVRLEIDLGEEPEEEDDIPEAEERFNPEEYDMDQLLADLEEDMRLLTDFLSKIYRRFYVKGKEGDEEDPSRDDKLQQLLTHFNEDTILKGHKVAIFTEYRDTARYLHQQLVDAGLERVEQIDSTRKIDREVVIKRFAPYYNCYDETADLFGQTELDKYLENPIDILISTDILSEGLNLQDASLIINYDLHWNPVRLMQRIGRVDRRLDPEIEKDLNRPPELDGKIYFWNFLPPKELEDLLKLQKRLTGKILRINKILGIEGALLTPDDPNMALKLFNERYEGKETIEELMNLERQKVEAEQPEVWASLARLPRRLFSGKSAGDGFAPIVNRRGEVISNLEANLTPGLFCAYRIPSIDEDQHGEVQWYFWEAESGEIHEDLEAIWTAIRCQSGTPRKVEQGVEGLKPARQAIEKKVKALCRDRGLPATQKPTLVCWMEIS